MGKKKFVITEEMLKNAVDYIPLGRKVALAKVIASHCIVRSKTADQNQKGVEFLALPTLWVEDLETKRLYEMSMLLSEYLKVNIPENFTDKEYDHYASAHILNQLERFKSNALLKDKVFDILDDYRDLKKFLDTEIFNETKVRNDTADRLSAAISIVSNPENIEKMKSELDAAMSKFEVAQKDAKKMIEGKAEEAS